MQTYKKIAVAIIVLLLSDQLLWASPTGLNNIPTTDVESDKTLVLQSWLVTGEDANPLYFTGAKYGILDKIEIGVDSKVGSGDAGPVTLQSKLKVFDFDFGLGGLIGAEGITFGNIDENLVPYAVLSQDLKFLRLHEGYGFQKDNFSMFFGVDKTIKFFEQDLILRSDLKQVNDRDDLLISGGFLLTLPFNLVFESWLSIPTEGGAQESVTVKLNYVIKF